jgi:hypothetical protein
MRSVAGWTEGQRRSMSGGDSAGRVEKVTVVGRPVC